MLRGIPPLLTPELLHAMAAMGHGDALVIVDANFPAVSVGRRVVTLAGADSPTALDAVLALFPVDTFEAPAALTMEVVGDPAAVPPAVAALQAVLARHGVAQASRGTLERHAFYARAREAFAVVRTGELRPYGNILLIKGVVNDVGHG